MPSLVGLSPRLADHTFPRSDHELRLVASALGNLSELVEKKAVRILRTEIFSMLVRDFKWDQNGGIKNEIFTHLNLWFLNGRSVLIEANSTVQHYTPHPIPEGCRSEGKLEELWAEEMGKILVTHDQFVTNGEFFIGIACERAFAGEEIGNYEAHDSQRHFPLVGPGTCNCNEQAAKLVNAYELRPPSGYTQTEVSFDCALKNCHLLGATEVRPPKRGSHFKVKFAGARSWTLDPNNDPVPERFLKQLIDITGHTFETIIYTLREGVLPPERLRCDS